MLAGTLLPVVIFYLVLQLKLSRWSAFGAAMLIVLENSLLVQSRFILLDAFLLLFGFAALLFYLLYENRGHRLKYLIAASALAALSLSVKWTGATFLAIIVIAEIIKGVENHKSIEPIKYPISRFIFLLVLPFIIYFSIFAIHLRLLYKSGPGDAFMTPAFQKTLVGNNVPEKEIVQPLSLFGKFKELNIEMYKSNATLTASHPYSSKWYSWPFMIRPVYYWNESLKTTPATEARIYFLGNPVIWWVSTVAMAILLIKSVGLAWDYLRKRQSEYSKGVVVLLGGGFVLNLLPFVGIKRAMFLYHYMTALVFSIIALIYLLERFKIKKVLATILIVGLASFIFFAPLSYGLPLTQKAYNARAWLKTWR